MVEAMKKAKDWGNKIVIVVPLRRRHENINIKMVSEI